MKTTLPSLTERKSKADADWLKTPYPNLIRYRPSGTYFGRVRVNGKLIRRSVKTHVLSVAKVTLTSATQPYVGSGKHDADTAASICRPA